MSTFLYVFRELLGSIKPRGAMLLLLTGVLIFAALGAFSAFFLFQTPAALGSSPLTGEEFVAYLDPQLTTLQIEALYAALRADPSVARIDYLLPQELGRRDASGALLVQPVEGAAEAVFAQLDSSGAVFRVDRPTASGGIPGALSPSARTGLLVGLLVGIAVCLIVARFGLKDLLQAFDGQLRMMHLAGVDEAAYSVPVLVAGISCGLIASAAFIAVLYAFHLAAVSNPTSVITLAPGLRSAGCVRRIAALGGAIGVGLGLLVGGLGVGLVFRRGQKPGS